MKRFLSIFISIAMLVCMLPMTGMATTPAADDAEKLVFDMDLSNYATEGVKNSVSENDSVISTSNNPVLTTVAGMNTPALELTWDETKAIKTINITDSAFVNQDELTVEMWVKADNWNANYTDISDRLFALEYNNATYMDLYRYGNGVYRYNYSGDYTNSPYINTHGTLNTRSNGKWTHLVFTRKWVPDEVTETEGEEVTPTGKWTAKYYVDGLCLGTTTSTESVSRSTEPESTRLIIGGCRNVSGFAGAIAELKVYNSILENHSVASKYQASVGDYYKIEDDKLVFDLNIGDSAVTDAVSHYGYTTLTSGNLSGAYGSLFNGTKYITFASYDTSASSSLNRNRYITVNSNDFLNQNEMTFETWIRPNYSAGGWGALFNGIAYMYYAGSNGNYTWSACGDVKPAGSMFGPTFNLGNYKDEWLHLVATRKWEPTGEYTTEGKLGHGKWTATYYINGQKLGTAGPTGSATYERAYETKDSKLTIGNFGTSNGFYGDISTFKVYNSILSEQKILSKYKASKDNYSAVGSDGLIFDMDLSAYDGTSETAIANAVANNDSDIAVNGTPVVNMLENDQKYLTFGNTAAVAVFDDVLINRDEMTFETWLRGSNFTTVSEMGEAGQIFTAGSYASRLYKLSGNTNLWWEPAGDLGLQSKRIEKNAVPYNNVWTHVVFTREYDSEAGKWTAVLYINGQKAGSKEFEQARSAVATLNNKLIIGNNSAFTNGFNGDIATFKVYNRVFDIGDVSDSYMNTRSTFLGDIPFVTLSEFNASSTSVTATLDSTLTARNAFVVMALYDSAEANANMLKAVVGTEINFEGITLAEGYVVKCFIWNNTDELKPITGATPIQCLRLAD